MRFSAHTLDHSSPEQSSMAIRAMAPGQARKYWPAPNFCEVEMLFGMSPFARSLEWGELCHCPRATLSAMEAFFAPSIKFLTPKSHSSDG